MNYEQAKANYEKAIIALQRDMKNISLQRNVLERLEELKIARNKEAA